MTIIDNVNLRLGDELKQDLTKGTKLKIIASTFSIYAFKALKKELNKKELNKIDSLEFIFDSPTFTKEDLSDNSIKEERKFHIPKKNREQDVYGNQFEIQLRNKLNQKAIAKECADWIKSKVVFKSNKSNAHMPRSFCLDKGSEDNTAYASLTGLTVSDLGYKARQQPLHTNNKIIWQEEH